MSGISVATSFWSVIRERLKIWCERRSHYRSLGPRFFVQGCVWGCSHHIFRRLLARRKFINEFHRGWDIVIFVTELFAVSSVFQFLDEGQVLRRPWWYCRIKFEYTRSVMHNRPFHSYRSWRRSRAIIRFKSFRKLNPLIKLNFLNFRSNPQRLVIQIWYKSMDPLLLLIKLWQIKSKIRSVLNDPVRYFIVLEPKPFLFWHLCFIFLCYVHNWLWQVVPLDEFEVWSGTTKSVDGGKHLLLFSCQFPHPYLFDWFLRLIFILFRNSCLFFGVFITTFVCHY